MGDVAVAGASAEPAPVSAIYRLADVANPTFLTALGDNAEIHGCGLLAFKLLCKVSFNEAAVVRVGHHLNYSGIFLEFIGAIARDLFGRWRDVDKVSIRGDPILPIVSKISDSAKPLFTRAQRFLRTLVLTNLQGELDHTHNIAIVVSNRRALDEPGSSVRSRLFYCLWLTSFTSLLHRAVFTGIGALGPDLVALAAYQFLAGQAHRFACCPVGP